MGIILGALAGAGKAAGEIADANTKLWGQQELAAQQADIVAKRDEALLRLKQRFDREDDEYKNSPEFLAREAASAKSRATSGVEIEGGLIGSRAKNAETAFDAGKNLRTKQEEEALAKARTLREEELQAIIERGNDPDYLKAIGNEANAKRDRSGDGLRAIQIESAKIALDEKKAEMKMPPAVREKAKHYRDLALKAAETVNAAIKDGTAPEESLNKLKAIQAAHSKTADDLYAQYIPGTAKEVTTDGLDKDLAARIAELSAAKAKQTKPEKKAAAIESAPAYVPPADSPAGQAAARRSAAAEAASAAVTEKSTKAASAFSEVRGDPAKAMALQDSPLFSALTPAQKSQIYKIVNAK